MDFRFSDDQLMFRDSVRGALDRVCNTDTVRKLWSTESGRSAELWSSLGELGILGLLAPESAGGLGMNEVDLVLPLVETGYAAFPGPVVECATVGVALLNEVDDADISAKWLSKVASGEAIVTVGHATNAFVADAHIAEVLILQHGGDLHAVLGEEVNAVHQATSDPGRKLYRVQWEPSRESRIATGAQAQALLANAFDRGAFGCAAQLLGAAQRLIDIAVDYAKQREQFGKPIGSFQAIKHMLAGVQVGIEFAKPLLYRAADSLALKKATQSADVSQAKASAGEAALAAAKTSLQVHGAIGYTWECDAQIWMKRAWSLDLAWGSSAWHRKRIADAVIDNTFPAQSFGFAAH